MTTTYRVTAIDSDNVVEHAFFADNLKAWAHARFWAANREHVTYALVQDQFTVLKSYSFYNGTPYDADDHGPVVDCAACPDRPHANACSIPGCDYPSVHVSHYGSRMCKSGKRPHCTCDACF